MLCADKGLCLLCREFRQANTLVGEVRRYNYCVILVVNRSLNLYLV